MATFPNVTRSLGCPLAVLLVCWTLFTPTAAGQGMSLVSPEGSIDLNRYYTAAETHQIMRELHRLYPEMTELHKIGESYLGQELLLMEITNEATGPAVEKTALYVDGGLHAGELTGSAVALHLLVHVLNGYGQDPRVTALLDRSALYIRPKFNPDGSDLALIYDHSLRSSVHPVDDDEDGEADEDPGEDLDGDGWITQMRIPDPAGPSYADPGDPRNMRPVPADGQVPQGARRYRVMREGIDNDGDGRFNEDGFGGIDLNRNFPRNWEREHLQGGAGEFPLSEPETYAAVRFIQDHPNIVGIVHGHTSGGFVYRLPSASNPALFPADDLELIEHLGAEYTRTTGRPVEASSTDPTQHRYGTLISWGYWDQGLVGWVPEFSPGPEEWVTDYDGDGEIEREEEFRFNDEVLGGRYFSDWTAYAHPEFGPVEIGGWHSKFWGQNPPAEYLEDETRQQLPWILYLLEQAPVLEMDDPVVTEEGDGLYRIEVTVRNTGFQPTSLTGRGTVGRRAGRGGRGGLGQGRGRAAAGPVTAQVVKSPYVVLEMAGLELVEGRPRLTMGHLRGTGPFITDAGPRERRVSWLVRATGGERAVRVTARADKGGTVRGAWVGVR